MLISNQDLGTYYHNMKQINGMEKCILKTEMRSTQDTRILFNSRIEERKEISYLICSSP